MPNYEELKTELLEISKIVERFPDDVKPKVYELLVAEFLGKKISSGNKQSIRKPKPKTSDSSKASTSKSPRKKAAGKESYSIDRNLNLRGDKSIPSFKEFYGEKSPGSGREFNTIAVYYLKKLMGMDIVTLNHAYTCYSEVKKRPPGAFRQSFTDTKNKLGYVEFDSDGNLNIPHRGIVFVEHDLPKTKKAKSKE